ncbi:MAG: DUF2298 domain-containing protein [Anaerolineae bacterium]|nr:DUF2298 domain-containing protein [Anaerolineae bacterium]
MQTHRSKSLNRAVTILLLFCILVVASFLRFSNLNWDEGQWIHPDEGHMRIINAGIAVPDDLGVYFDTHTSSLNPRTNNLQYSYGTLPLFATRFAGEWLDGACDTAAGRIHLFLASVVAGEDVTGCTTGTFTGFRSAQVGRAISALADLGTIVLVFLIGREMINGCAGLLAACLYAFTAFAIQQAHFFTVDSTATFFSTAVILFAVRVSRGGHWFDFVCAGLMTGLAAGCKVSAAFVASAVALAGLTLLLSRRNSASPRSIAHVGLCLSLAGAAAFLAFRTVQPYAFEGPGFFGLRPSAEWFGRLRQIAAEQSGELDFPSGRQWANRPAVVFSWINMVVWGMGIPLGLAAWIGWAVVGYKIFRGAYDYLAPWGWATLVFLYQSTRWVQSMRYFLVLYPVFVLFAVVGLVQLLRRASRKRTVLGSVTTIIVLLGTVIWGLAMFSIYTRSHTRLAASRWVFENVPTGAVVANEHWDWGLPLRVDGHDPFRDMYSGIEMENYNEDTEQKRAQLYDWLDQTDYIFLASNRLYASIPRLPARYPLTIAYYEHLFSGELGFRLVADFTSYPAIGPFQFADQENSFALNEPEYRYQNQPINIPLPAAEEAFSVYDHPRVLIFEKTPDYSHDRVEELLGSIDVGRALHGLKAIEVSEAPNLLEFDGSTWADQQDGGTWSDMFNRENALNRFPALAAVCWWATMVLIGWAAFPIVFKATTRLNDRGYGLAKILGLLLVSYATWLAASLKVMPNTRETIARMTALLALVGCGVAWLNRQSLREYIRTHWRLLAMYEVLFAALFALWCGVRVLNPDLWHPVVGGEKPMDFAYFNAVMKSTWFPPYNPWYSGSTTNYYYFGFVIIGTITKLIGTVPAIAYNLAVPLVYALTGCGAFAVAYSLFQGSSRLRRAGGFFAVACTVLLGNLGVVHLIRSRLILLGGELFPSSIPGFPETVAALRGLWEVIAHGASLGLRPESWYWYPTRIIPTPPGEVGPISEFPAFTFLYADLHAHMIALPITLLALALAVHWARTRRPGWLSVALGGLVIGALWPTNSWDYPTYLAVGIVALGIGGWPTASDTDRRSVEIRALAGRILMLAALTKIAFLPFTSNYVQGYSSLQVWRGSQTPLDIYLWIHAIALLPIVSWLALAGSDAVKRLGFSRVVVPMLIGLAGLLVIGVGGVFAGLPTLPPVAALAVPIGLVSAWLVFSRDSAVEVKLLSFLIGTSTALSLGVEMLVLKGDIGRMNTVFKFYLQVWVMLSLGAGVCYAAVLERFGQWQPEWRNLWSIAMGLLVAGGALFIPLGVRARAGDRMSPGVGTTLDGMAFMEFATVYDGAAGQEDLPISLHGDYEAILWLQDNVQGSPVIIEGLGSREYLWANRVSIYTGLPSVIGWRWHQVQQRAALPDQMVQWRRDDVNTFYNTSSIPTALEILGRYGVRYIYVGAYEKAYYGSDGLGKLDSMVQQGLLETVYDRSDVRVYEVIASG